MSQCPVSLCSRCAFASVRECAFVCVCLSLHLVLTPLRAFPVFQDAAALDRLAEHGDGRLAPNIARNSLYVKFDPLLGRPSVLPEIQRLAKR